MNPANQFCLFGPEDGSVQRSERPCASAAPCEEQLASPPSPGSLEPPPRLRRRKVGQRLSSRQPAARGSGTSETEPLKGDHDQTQQTLASGGAQIATVSAGGTQPISATRRFEEPTTRRNSPNHLVAANPLAPAYYTLRQAAMACGISEKTIRREIDRKKLRANKFDRQLRIAHDDWHSYQAATKLGT